MTTQQAWAIAGRINRQEVAIFEQAEVGGREGARRVEAIDRAGRWATFTSVDEYSEYVSSH